MEKYFSKWEDEEVKTLFRFVEIKKSEGVALINIFKQYADKTQRHANSVRNYYYKELANLKLDTRRLKELNIDISCHFAKEVIPFFLLQTKELINKIDELISKGYSVRGACLKLSGGNASDMIRMQNKYRLETKYKERNMGNIIKMPIKKDVISDEEINALVLGLVS